MTGVCFAWFLFGMAVMCAVNIFVTGVEEWFLGFIILTILGAILFVKYGKKFLDLP